MRPQLFVHIHNKLETGPLKVFQTVIYTWFNIGCLPFGKCALGSYCLAVIQGNHCSEIHVCPNPKDQIPMTNCQSNLYWIRHLHNSFFHIIGELWQNVQNLAVKSPTCGSWLLLSFEHIAVNSTVDEQHGPWKIVVDLLNRNRQTKNHWPVSGR